MKRHGLLFLSIFLLSNLFVGCKKDFDRFTPNNDFSIELFFDILRPLAQNFVVSIAGEQLKSITTRQGTRVSFNPNDLLDAAGQRPNGNISIELIEIYSRGDMIKYRRFPVSSNRVLNSIGELFVKMTSNGKELHLKSPAALEIRVPAANPVEGKEVFYHAPDPVAGEDWIEASSTADSVAAVQIVEWMGASGIQTGYEFSTKRLGWMNAAAFLDDPNLEKGQARIQLPKKYKPLNTVAYVVFKDMASVLPLPFDSGANSIIQMDLPLNADVTLLIISRQGGDIYHLGQFPTTTRANLEVEIQPNEKPLQEIVNFLEDL